MSNFSIKQVSTATDQSAFLAVPAYIYRNDSHWVAPIESSVAKQFSEENSFFQYGRLQQFVAWQGEQPVGRVVAAVNDRLIEREEQSVGLMGFFECINEQDIAKALLDSAQYYMNIQGFSYDRLLEKSIMAHLNESMNILF